MKPSATDRLAARAEQLRAEHAAAQATADQLRAKLARLEAKLAGEPPPETGLDMLWKAAPPMARTRSSKYQCRLAWNRIPPSSRPPVSAVLAALRAWCRCPEWQKDDGQFIPALHRWIRDRRWEDLPEGTAPPDPSARYRCPQPTPPPVAPEDAATKEEIAAMFAKWHSNNPFAPESPATSPS
jgi:hypothetical protein